jgi:hypothetical protein
MRKLKRGTGVSHHTFENILRNEFVGVRAHAELAWFLACSRSFPVRLHSTRTGYLGLLPAPARSHYGWVSVSDSYRSAIPGSLFLSAFLSLIGV